MKRQSKLYLVFVLVLFFIIPLYKTQGMNDYNDKLLRANDYYPLFDVTLGYLPESEPSRIIAWRQAEWIFSPKMVVTSRAVYDEDSSNVYVRPEIDDNITIDFTLNIPELYGLYCSSPALGTYENIVVKDEHEWIVINETAQDDEVGLRVDFQGEMSCDAIVTGDGSGSGELHWDDTTSDSFVMQHKDGAQIDDPYQIVLSNFIYTVSIHVSYKLLSGTEAELEILFHRADAIIANTGDSEYTYPTVYVPGFQMIIPVVVLMIFSIGYMFKRKKMTK